jgi:hypothetical protein
MAKRKCFGCGSEFEMYQCTYTTKGIITLCPCSDCLVKSNCSQVCLEFIEKYFKSPNREVIFEEMFEDVKKIIKEKSDGTK